MNARITGDLPRTTGIDLINVKKYHLYLLVVKEAYFYGNELLFIEGVVE